MMGEIWHLEVYYNSSYGMVICAVKSAIYYIFLSLHFKKDSFPDLFESNDALGFHTWLTEHFVFSYCF